MGVTDLACRADYVRFKDAWATAQGLDAGTLKAGDIDRKLHWQFKEYGIAGTHFGKESTWI